MRSSVLALGFLMAALAAAPAGAQPAAPTSAAPQGAGFDARSWQLLGERAVQGRRDRDRINVGAYQGAFDQIVVVVPDGDIQLSKITITFANKQTFRPPIRHIFREGSRSRVIDLPGNNRVIQRVDLVYSRFGRGQGNVQLWGRDTRAGDTGGAGWRGRGWDQLGQAQVTGKLDRDSVRVGRDDGRFTKLAFVVEDSDLELFDVVVTFGNGETFSPAVRRTFREGSRSHEIDLPGTNRAVQRIDFRYGNLPGGGRATVVVYGLPEKGAPGWDSRGWSMLGEREVTGKGDLDRLVVSKDQRTFRQLTVVVLDSDLELFDLVVTFGNGQTFNPRLKAVFKEGSRTRVIDLPADRRTIEKVEMSYGNLPGGGRARVQVWAK